MSSAMVDRHLIFRCAARPLLAAVIIGGAAVALATIHPAGHLVGVAIVTVAAAVADARSARIPNRLVVAALGITVLRAVKVAGAGDATAASLAGGVIVGIVLSGAVTLLLIWLWFPALVGGGDWKLLAALGAALGLVDPLAAAVAGIVAVGIQLAAAVRVRRRAMPFAPALATGFFIGALSTVWFHHGAGGWS